MFSEIDPQLTDFCLEILVIRFTLNFDNATKRHLFFLTSRRRLCRFPVLFRLGLDSLFLPLRGFGVGGHFMTSIMLGCFSAQNDGEGTLCDSIGVVIIIR